MNRTVLPVSLQQFFELLTSTLLCAAVFDYRELMNCIEAKVDDGTYYLHT